MSKALFQGVQGQFFPSGERRPWFDQLIEKTTVAPRKIVPGFSSFLCLQKDKFDSSVWLIFDFVQTFDDSSSRYSVYYFSTYCLSYVLGFSFDNGSVPNDYFQGKYPYLYFQINIRFRQRRDSRFSQKKLRLHWLRLTIMQNMKILETNDFWKERFKIQVCKTF